MKEGQGEQKNTQLGHRTLLLEGDKSVFLCYCTSTPPSGAQDTLIIEAAAGLREA